MKEFALSIYTPTENFFEGQVVSLVLETPDGLLGILADHMPSVISVKAGVLKIRTADGNERKAAASQGFALVRGKSVKVLLQSIEWADEIDIERSIEALKRAQKRLEKKDELLEREYILATAALERAKARLRVTGSYADRVNRHIK